MIAEVQAQATRAATTIAEHSHSPTFDTLALMGTVIAVGLALAALIMRSTARLDADRRETQRRFDEHQRQTQRQFDEHQRETRDTVNRVLDKLERITERQAHVEGRIEERGHAGAD